MRSAQDAVVGATKGKTRLQLRENGAVVVNSITRNYSEPNASKRTRISSIEFSKTNGSVES